MIKFNYLVILISSCIPLIVGAIWYNPRLFGQKTEPNNGNKQGHKPMIYLLTFILSIMYSVTISFQVIHQLHFQSMFFNEVGFLNGEGNAFKDFEFIMAAYKNNFRSFGHGAFHGLLNGLFILLPLFAINGMFEGKTWRYIVTTWGYWTTCGVIMGAIICQFY
jgi:Protein of unknown function (DUF1761)